MPETVRTGETDYVILDCDYDLENTPSRGLVVKWFFNGNDLAYQWIYSREPRAGEPAAKYVDLTYKASDDPYTKYRAMKLNKPGIDLTGEYTCVVCTFVDETSASASMLVYSAEDTFDLGCRKQTINDKDGVEITCKAEGLFPQPTLDISIDDVPIKQASKESITLRKDGLYNILSRASLLDEDLPEAAVIKCSLGIPKANYNVSRKTVYYPGRLTTVSAPTTKLLRKLEIQALDNSHSDAVSENFGNRLAITFPVVLAYLGILCVLNELSN